MKKQFLLITILLSMTLSACSYKNTKEINSELGKEGYAFSQIHSTETNQGEKYIITECKYMHPLSSKGINIEHCTEYYYISEDSFFIERGSDVPEGQANSEEYRFINWGWQEFPYTDAEWNALYSVEGFGAQTDLLANHDEVLYQPLMLGYSILKVDGELWLVDMNDINGEQAIWSIYVIEPEKEGVKLPGESITESLNLSDYLAQYATDTFEGDYVKLDAVEGLSYVYNENVLDSGEVSGSFVTIYNQGIHCGRFEIIELPEGGLQTERQFMQFHARRSSHGSVKPQSQETIDGVVRYTFLVSELPYTYGDTEWLIEAGLFTDENEACKESCEYVDVLWSKEGADQGYCFSVNKALLSEKAIAQLTEAVSFKEGAFEPSNMEKALSEMVGVPYFKEEYRELITPENASRLAYEIVVGEETYRVPEHTFALRVDEKNWEIYCYTSDGTGGKLIGSIALSDDGSNKLEVNIMDFGEEW